MASVCSSGEIGICTDGASESMIDERELTLAGRDFVPPPFSPVRSSASTSRNRKTKLSTRRSRSASIVSVESAPALAYHELRELDLESTLVAKEDEPAPLPVLNGSQNGREGDHGLSNSYMQAVTGGRLTDSCTRFSVRLS